MRRKAEKSSGNSRFIHLLERAKHLRELTGRKPGPGLTRYFNLLAKIPHDDQLYSMVNGQLAIQELRYKLKEIPFVEPDHDLPGDIIIGKTRNNRLVRIPLNAFTQHLLQIGSTGSGKSTLLRRIRLQAAPKVKGIWTFDFFKSQERHLLPFYKEAGRDYVICHWSRLRINDLQPVDNEPPIEFANRWLDVYKTSFNASEAAESSLRDAIVKLFTKFGVFNGSKTFPTLLDLTEHMKQTNMHPSMKRSILNHLNTIILSVGEEGVSYSQGWSIGKLAEMCIDFEFRGLSHSLQTYRCKILVSSLFAYRVYNSALDTGVQTLVDFDEGHRLYQDSGDYIGTMTGLVRGAGIALMVSTQTHDVDRSIRVNSAIKIMGRLNDHQDLTAFGRSLGINREQIEWCKINLKPGIDIAKLSLGNWQRPVLFYTPPFDLPPKVTNRDAEESMRILDKLPVVRRKEHVEIIQIREESIEERFIRHLYDNPRLSSTEHYAALNMSMHLGMKIKNQSLRQGLITEWKAETGRRGKPMTLLYPSEKWLNQRNLKPVYRNRGGFLHWYYLDTARIYYEKQGYEAYWEKQMNGKFVDLLVKQDGYRRAVECQLENTERALANIIGCLNAGLEVELLCGNRRFKEQVEKEAKNRLKKAELSKIYFRVLSHYMN